MEAKCVCVTERDMHGSKVCVCVRESEHTMLAASSTVMISKNCDSSSSPVLAAQL